MISDQVHTVNSVFTRLIIMKKVILSALVSGCLATMAGAAVADTGNISFIGEITNNACAIGGGQQGADMTVLMGSVPATMLAAVGDRGPETEFTITLIGCDTSIQETAAISFRPGAGNVVDSRLLSLESGAGAQGVAVGLSTAVGDDIIVGGGSTPYTLIDGTNILRFKAHYEAVGTVTAGPANARAVFQVDYS